MSGLDSAENSSKIICFHFRSCILHDNWIQLVYKMMLCLHILKCRIFKKALIWILVLLSIGIIAYFSAIKLYPLSINMSLLRFSNWNRLVSEHEYILWPSPFSLDSFPCLPSRKQPSCMSLLPRVEPLPRLSAPKIKPSCDALIRSTVNYSLFLNTLLRSLEIFWPRDMGKIIVVLDDSKEDRSYALTLPDYVTVFFEQLPPFIDVWDKDITLSSRNAYNRAQWSNFISDRYSSADFVTIFDADQVISGGGQLQLLFDWDVKLQKYKPIFICIDKVDLYDSFTLSYGIFGMSRYVGIECMKSLPVVMYRDTFPKIRKYLVNYFLLNRPSIYNDTRLTNLSCDYDRDHEWVWLDKDKKKTNNSSPTYFDRAFAYLTANCNVCQFCIFGGFIYTHPDESSRYAFKVIGYTKSAKRLKKEQIQLINYARSIDNYLQKDAEHEKNGTHDYHIFTPECTQLHSGAHIPYIIGGPKMSQAYFRLAEQIMDDGVCKVSRPEDCNYEYCKSRGWNYDAIKQRELYSNLSTNTTFPSQFYSNQEVLLGWEQSIRAPGGRPTCRGINYAILHHYFEWQQRFETKSYDHFKRRQCRTQWIRET